MNAKHSCHIFFAFAIVVLLLANSGGVLAAGSSNPVDTGLTLSKGPQLEIYLPSTSYVSMTEVCFIINYASGDAILKIMGQWTAANGGQNKTYLTQVIEGGSSQILQLDFTDIDVSYWITVERGGQVIFGIEKNRPAFYLPAPRDQSGWHLSPPVKTDPLAYSEKALQAIVAAITLQTVLIAVVVIALGAVLGAVVKQTTRFLVPWDFLSLLFCAVVLLDIVFHWFDGISGSDKIWNVAFLVGYQMGFWLWRIDYLTPIRTNLKEKTISFLPIPYYYPDSGEGCCLATQTNKALFKRLFLGIHHELGTDAGISMDWQAIGKKPYLPKIHVRALWVEKERIIPENVSWWKFTLQKFTTEYKLAYASGVSKAQFLVWGKAYFTIQDKYERLSLKHTELELTHRSEAVGSGAAMVEATVRTGPASRMKRWFGNDVQEIDLETGEHVLEEIEAAEVEPQERADEYVPEQQAEEDRKRPERQGSKRKPKQGQKQKAQQRNETKEDEEEY